MEGVLLFFKNFKRISEIIIKNINGVKKAKIKRKYSELVFQPIFLRRQSSEKALLKSGDIVDANEKAEVNYGGLVIYILKKLLPINFKIK